jgi:hypothetical protein
MGTFKSIITSTGSTDKANRSLNVTRTAEISEIFDSEVKLGPSDSFDDVLLFASEGTLGASPSNPKQILIQNASGSGAIEVALKYNQHSYTTDIGEATFYLHYILAPDEIISLPNVRGLLYDEKTSGGNANRQAFAKVTVGTESTYGATTTDGEGRWDSTDLTISCGGTDTGGIVPGSLRVLFYKAGYQGFGYIANKQPAQTSKTDTGLTASTTYGLSIDVDGGGPTDVSFTTDATDVTWGSPTSGNGVLAKIHDAIEALDLRCSIDIGSDGDIIVTSDLKDTGSTIALDDPTAGTSIFDSGTIPDETELAPAVGTATDNDNIAWDNGDKTITREAGGTGTISSYDAGELGIALEGMPVNSGMEFAWNFDSSHSGNVLVDHLDHFGNSLEGIYARSIPTGTASGNAGPGNLVGETVATVRVLAFE